MSNQQILVLCVSANICIHLSSFSLQSQFLWLKFLSTWARVRLLLRSIVKSFTLCYRENSVTALVLWELYSIAHTSFLSMRWKSNLLWHHISLSSKFRCFQMRVNLSFTHALTDLLANCLTDSPNHSLTTHQL